MIETVLVTILLMLAGCGTMQIAIMLAECASMGNVGKAFLSLFIAFCITLLLSIGLLYFDLVDASVL